jgi:hypothetical protein
MAGFRDNSQRARVYGYRRIQAYRDGGLERRAIKRSPHAVGPVKHTDGSRVVEGRHDTEVCRPRYRATGAAAAATQAADAFVKFPR